MEYFEDLAKHHMTDIEKEFNQRNTSCRCCLRLLHITILQRSVELRAGNKLRLVVKIHNDLTKIPTQWF